MMRVCSLLHGGDYGVLREGGSEGGSEGGGRERGWEGGRGEGGREGGWEEGGWEGGREKGREGGRFISFLTHVPPSSPIPSLSHTLPPCLLPSPPPSLVGECD